MHTQVAKLTAPLPFPVERPQETKELALEESGEPDSHSDHSRVGRTWTQPGDSENHSEGREGAVNRALCGSAERAGGGWNVKNVFS